MSGASSVAEAGVSFEAARERLEDVAARLFGSDPRVRSVGISRHGSGYGYRAVRNSAALLPLSTNVVDLGDQVAGIPVRFTDTPAELQSLLLVADSGPSSPAAASLVPEVHRHRPLVCGLQIQNFDDDDRQGLFAQGLIAIGTLGCFVTLRDGSPGLVSNNHVIAGENRGRRGQDRILQPGSSVHRPDDQIGRLEDFVSLLPSAHGDTFANGRATLNEVDAAIARLDAEVEFQLGYLPSRKLLAPNGIARARVGDRVFKVGRTTGLTFGEVVEVATIVGPVPYDTGPAWFRRSLTIEGLNGTQFSDRGDSGSAILRTNGEVVGLLYAGNGQQTYACPIGDTLAELGCALA
jgi:hypothetical protein